MVVFAIWAALSAAHPVGDEWLEYEDEFGDRPLVEPGSTPVPSRPVDDGCCGEDAASTQVRNDDSSGAGACVRGLRRWMPARWVVTARWQAGATQTDAEALAADLSLRNRNIVEYEWRIVSSLRWVGEPSRCARGGAR